MTKKDEIVLASNIDLSKAYIRSSGSSHGAQGQRIFSSRTPHTMWYAKIKSWYCLSLNNKNNITFEKLIISKSKLILKTFYK